jgi:hypothetical protein
MSIQVKVIPTNPLLGRSLIEHDDRSRAYPTRGVLTVPGVTRVNKTWRRGAAYDQGPTSSCVAQTFKGTLNTAPFSSQVSYSLRTRYDALDFYRGGQLSDEWPGEEPTYSGTSANGVCKYLKSKSLISEYRWCFGLDDVLDTLVQHGPVGIGIWWYDSMFATDASGFISPTGSKAGGHEVELIGINVTGRYVTGMNSWGSLWGVNGRFKLTWNSLGSLLQDDGDATTVVSL